MRPPATTASITIRHSSEARGSPPPRRPYRRRAHRGLAAEVFRSTGLPWPSLLLATALLCLMCPPGGRADGVEVVNCCTGPDAAVDCSSGVDYQGQRYFCMKLETPDVRACVSCIPSARSDVQCSCCCGTTNPDCELEWSWGAVLATLSVSAVFATCSGILALAEKRRKRKGLSLARAWSLPHGMPVLRATVVDLSDAVRGRASIWSMDGLSDHWSANCDNNDQSLEHVGLLEEIPHDSVYGALVGQGDADIPVAKLAEDNWVTAMAWRQANTPALYDNVAGHEDPPTSPSTSWSRWRSARATARHARRTVTATTAYSDLGLDRGGGEESGGAGSEGAHDEEQEATSVGSLESVVVVRHSSSRSVESLG